MNPSSQKVFFLGAPKMGTTSIHNALIDAGFKSIHEMMFGFKSHQISHDSSYFDKSQFFTDGAFHNFVQLHKWYPNAKFVLLDRDVENWSLSVYNWIRNIEKRKHLKEEKFASLISRLFVGKKSLYQIVLTWLVYKKRTLTYFKNNPNFIHINVVDGTPEDWDDLCEFLKIDLVKRWDNQQIKKDFPDGILNLIQKAKMEASKKDDVYPIRLKHTIYEKLFQFHLKFMIRHYIHERHLMRNLKISWNEKQFGEVVIHLYRFIQVGLHLLLRRWIHKEHKLSSYLI